MLDAEVNGFSLFVVIFGAYTALMGAVGTSVSCMETAKCTSWIFLFLVTLAVLGARGWHRAQGEPDLGGGLLFRGDMWQSERDPLRRVGAPGRGLLRVARGHGVLHSPRGHRAA